MDGHRSLITVVGVNTYNTCHQCARYLPLRTLRETDSSISTSISTSTSTSSTSKSSNISLEVGQGESASGLRKTLAKTFFKDPVIRYQYKYFGENAPFPPGCVGRGCMQQAVCVPPSRALVARVLTRSIAISDTPPTPPARAILHAAWCSRCCTMVCITPLWADSPCSISRQLE